MLSPLNKLSLYFQVPAIFILIGQRQIYLNMKVATHGLQLQVRRLETPKSPLHV